MCNHKWVDTGLPSGVTWCKYCNADAHWDGGKLVIDRLPVLSLAAFGIPLEYQDLMVAHAFYLEGHFSPAKVVKGMHLTDVTQVDYTTGDYMSCSNLLVDPNTYDQIEIVVDNNEWSYATICFRNLGRNYTSGRVAMCPTAAQALYNYMKEQVK